MAQVDLGVLMGSRSEEIRNMSRQSGLTGDLSVDQHQPGVPDSELLTTNLRINCPVCDEEISAKAKKCRYCGETLDVTMRIAQEAQRASQRGGNVYMNAASAPIASPEARPASRTKSKVTAGLLAILLGGIGAHKFYLDRAGQGLIYLIFCWTFIPGIIGLIEGIVYLTMPDERFWEKYG